MTKPDRPIPPRTDNRPWGSLSKRQQEDRIHIAFAKARMGRMARENGQRITPPAARVNGSTGDPR